MPVFTSKKFRSAARANTFATRFRAAMARHPFLLFGLPFMSVVVAGSFVLTPATAIRYEKNDRKMRQMSREEELGVGKNKRKVDIREEYFVSDQNTASWPSRRGFHANVLRSRCRGSYPKIRRAGNRSESNDYRGRGMASCSSLP